MDPQAHSMADRLGRSNTAPWFDGDDGARSGHRALAERKSWIILESRVAHSLNRGMLTQELGKLDRGVFGARASKCERAQAAKGEEGFQRPWKTSEQCALRQHSLGRLGIGEHEGPGQEIGVSTNHLGGTVQHYIGSMGKGLLAERCGEGVVAHHARALIVSECGDGGDVSDLEHGVRWRLDPHEVSPPTRLADRGGVGDVDGAQFDATLVGQGSHSDRDAGIRVSRSDHDRTRGNSVEQRTGRCHPGGERQAMPSLQRADRGLQGEAGARAVAGILEVPARVIGRRGFDRHVERCSGRPGRATQVDDRGVDRPTWIQFGRLPGVLPGCAGVGLIKTRHGADCRAAGGDSVSVVPRPRVAVIFGGRSSEHSISCISATSVLRVLDRSHFDVVALGIGQDGRWVEMPDDPDDWSQSHGSGSGAEALPTVPLGGTRAPMLPQQLLDGVDVAFPVLHGPWGEDGTVQGMLEMAGIAYVGSGVLASAVAMDKGFMKSLLAAAGLPVGPWVVVTDPQWRTDAQSALHRIEPLGMPVFVKPARAGSSMGITKVSDPSGLADAIDHARTFDPRIVVEAHIADAREIECGVLTDGKGGAFASTCAEIRVRAGHDFYDFEAKHLDDSADLIVPADVPDAVRERVGELSCAAFDALNCEGLARVDFFVPMGEGSAVLEGIMINEVNTMPGFTPISMFPRMWAASDVPYSQLVDHLVRDALRRGVGLR